jgi:hypothetical protein
MGQHNCLLTCVATVMAACLGAYSAYVMRSGLPWSLGYEQSYRRLASLDLSSPAPLSLADARMPAGCVCLVLSVNELFHRVSLTELFTSTGR